jgi:Domain of unknown function (DUF4382)
MAITMALVAFAGCGGDGGKSGGGGGGGTEGTFKLRTTNSTARTHDAARAGQQGTGDAVALRVSIDEVRLNRADGSPERIPVATQVIDLLNLRTFTLAEAEIPVGDYQSIGLIVTSAEIQLADGSVKPVKVPSGPQTGLKLNIDFPIRDGFDTLLELDWNTGNSVHRTGNGKWMLRPTALKVTRVGQQPTIDNVTVTGASLAPATANPGDTNVPMLGLTFTVDDNFADINALTVSYTGTDAADTVRVAAWLDAGLSGFDPSEDVPLVEGDFSAGPAVLPVAQTVNTSAPLVIFLACDIAPTAVADGTHTVGLQIASPADIATPDAIDLTTSTFPISSTQTTIPAPAP